MRFLKFKTEIKIVILGDMLELGEKSDEEHIKVLEWTSSCTIRKVTLLVGPVFKKVSANPDFKTFNNVDSLIRIS